MKEHETEHCDCEQVHEDVVQEVDRQLPPGEGREVGQRRGPTAIRGCALPAAAQRIPRGERGLVTTCRLAGPC